MLTALSVCVHSEVPELSLFLLSADSGNKIPGCLCHCLFISKFGELKLSAGGNETFVKMCKLNNLVLETDMFLNHVV